MVVYMMFWDDLNVVFEYFRLECDLTGYGGFGNEEKSNSFFSERLTDMARLITESFIPIHNMVVMLDPHSVYAIYGT